MTFRLVIISVSSILAMAPILWLFTLYQSPLMKMYLADWLLC
jgi:hypothetical protein